MLNTPKRVIILVFFLLGMIAAAAGLWRRLHCRTNRQEETGMEGRWRNQATDMVIILLFFTGTILMPIMVRTSFVHKVFPSVGYLSYLNLPCTLALLLSFLRLRKWTAADLLFFAAWLLLLIPMLLSNRELEFTRFVTVPFQNLLPVFFVFFRMNESTRQKTIRLFMFLFNCFIFFLLVFAIEEKFTGKAVLRAFTDWLIVHHMNAQEFQRFLTESRFFSFWGHPLTNALLFNSFLALNTVWYRSRGKKQYALLFFPAALAGVLLSGSKTGTAVCLLMLIVLCWERKKWLIACIPAAAALYFAGALNSIISRFVHSSLTSGRLEALEAYFANWYSRYPFRWLTGGGSNAVLDAGHPLFSCRQGFEFPLLMSALDYGIIYALVLMAGLWLYMTRRCLQLKQWTIWVCFTLVFAELNTYNGFALRNQDVFTIGCFIAMLMLNMLPENSVGEKLSRETGAAEEAGAAAGLRRRCS